MKPVNSRNLTPLAPLSGAERGGPDLRRFASELLLPSLRFGEGDLGGEVRSVPEGRMSLSPRTHRPGYTLVELLVVISIIAFLATITAVFYPSFQDKEMVNRGGEQVQQWLLTAKQQAKRDGLPTGVRFILSGTTCTEMQYVQQPDDFAQGQYIGQDPTETAALKPYSALLQNVDMTDTTAFPVQVGDYLEIMGGGMLHKIEAIDTAKNKIRVVQNGNPLPDLSSSPPRSDAPTNYRIIPAPRPLSGEAKMQLPTNVIIDFNPEHQSVTVPNAVPPAKGNPLSQNVPVRNGSYEIVFAPSGAVIGQGTGAKLIYLWLRDGTKDNSSDLLRGRPILITVQPRTGFIAGYPVAGSSGDPFVFARDAKGTGL